VAEVAACAATVMGDQVDLAETRRRVVPVGERPHRDLATQQRPRLGPDAAPDLEAATLRREEPVDRGGRDGEQLRPRIVVDVELVVTFQRGHDLGHERGEALAAGAAQHGPDLAQRHHDVVVVDDGSLGYASHLDVTMGERATSVAARPARERAQLIQDRALLRLRCRGVAVHRGLRHVPSLSHRQPHGEPPCACGQRQAPRGHFVVRQRTALEDISDESIRKLADERS